jgi:hypothetical protein
MTDLNRRPYALKVAAGVLRHADAMVSGWTPEHGQSDAEFAEKCLEFIATMTINAYEGAMAGELDHVAKSAALIIPH